LSGPRILLWKNKIWEASGSNLGDLAIITATIQAIRGEIPDAEIVMLSDDPPHTESLYPGVIARRFSPFAYVQAVREADLVVLGGGTLFSDATSMAVLVNTSAALLARFFGKPVALYGVASSRMGTSSRALVRAALRGTRIACLRDEETAEDLAPLAPAGLELEVTGDVAFSLRGPEPRPPVVDRVVLAPRRAFHYGNTLLPFALRRRLGLLPRGHARKLDRFKTVLAELADHLVETRGFEVVFLPMYSAIGSGSGASGFAKKAFSSRDDQMCRDIVARMRHADRATVFMSDRPREVLSLIAGARLLIGAPLHSLILSHVAETPFVGLAYQPKVLRFMEGAGLGRYVVPLDTFDCPLELDTFIGVVENCLSHEADLRQRMEEGNCLVRRTVDLPAARIAGFLSQGGLC